jgi:hypothetical protein
VQGPSNIPKVEKILVGLWIGTAKSTPMIDKEDL